MAVAPATTQPIAPALPLPPMPADWRSLAHAFLRHAKSTPHKVAVVDSTGGSATFRDVLLRAAVLSRLLERQIGDCRNVGLFLPPTVPAAIANVAVALMGRTAVNLNYSASKEVIDSCIDRSGSTHVVTSRRAIDKFKLSPKGEHVYLEDMPRRATKLDKAIAGLAAYVLPRPLVGTALPGLRKLSLDSVATIIFTSGSTGDPKGVVLTHGNVLANIHQFASHLTILPDEVVLGILPFFHSFGFTVTLWTGLTLGKKSAHHFNPLDARIVGHLCEEHKATLMPATPTFIRHYLHRCGPEQFRSLRYLLLGAEKLKPELAADIRSIWGIEPCEGYGTTELSPVVAVNVLESLKTPDGRTVQGNRPGTVGRPVPGTLLKTIDVETRADLPAGGEGIVCVKGPQVMRGYLNDPEGTAQVLRDGWYATGDLGFVDADGFLTITDRVSRFSKIGGEMVPHVKVESAVMAAAGVTEEAVAVTSVPDPKRGERLVVVYTDLKAEPREIYRRLAAGSLPKLWLPGADDFVQVEKIPVTGSGKVDLRGVRRLAKERLGD